MSKENSEKKEKIVPSKTPLAKRRSQGIIPKGFDDIFSDFRRSFEDLVSPFFPFMGEIEPALSSSIRYPSLDLVDQGDSYTVTAELPGFTKDMVDVEIDREGLSIRAESKEQKEEKDKNYLHRERTYSAMQRYVAFPEEVVPSKAEGLMKEGVLELKVPKKESKPVEKAQKVALK